MIYELMQSLQTRFIAAKFPTMFEYGPRRVAVEGYRDHLVVLERDRENADQVSSVRGQHTNPRRYLNRGLAARATIYAQSRLEGARVNEHEFECEQIIDAFLVAFHEWGSERMARLGDVSPDITEARYLKPNEFLEGEQWNGVAYLIRFRVGRGVLKRDYENQARPTGAATSTGGTIEIRQNADDAPEIVTLP